MCSRWTGQLAPTICASAKAHKETRRNLQRKLRRTRIRLYRGRPAGQMARSVRVTRRNRKATEKVLFAENLPNQKKPPTCSQSTKLTVRGNRETVFTKVGPTRTSPESPASVGHAPKFLTCVSVTKSPITTKVPQTSMLSRQSPVRPVL